jgi:hypothetical protein
MIFTPASMLAGELAADGLLRTISRRLEELLAVTTTAIIHQAAPGQNRNRSFCPEAPSNPTAPTKKSLPIESSLEWYRLPADGTAVHQTGRTDVLFHRHRQTVADCFKYRNKIGMETAREALKLNLERRRKNINVLLEAAEVCRVSKVMRPYLEALV